MRDEYYIGEYRGKDIPEILNLFSLSFQKETSRYWFLWKYQNAPWSSKGYVVVHGEKTVAFYGGIRLQFIFSGKTLWVYQFCDVMTHPKYRGRLITRNPFVVQLGKMFYSENPMDFAFGFPSIRHARLQSLMLGGKGYRMVQQYRKENLKSYPLRWRLKVKEGWEFFHKDDLKELQTQKTSAAPQILKDENYITWRYLKHPLKTYRLLAFKRINRLKGYVIFTIEENHCAILDILYGSDRDLHNILISLENHLVKKRTANEIRVWFNPVEPVTRYLDYLGYKNEDAIPVAFKPVNATCGVTPDIFYERYFYQMGDYDAS